MIEIVGIRALPRGAGFELRPAAGEVLSCSSAAEAEAETDKWAVRAALRWPGEWVALPLNGRAREAS